jgi:hypothetical protein
VDIKRSLRALMEVLAVAVAAVSACSAQQFQPDPLETKLVNIPEDLDHVPLAYALDRIGAVTEDLVLFGVEVPLDHGDQPLISAHITGGVTVHEALNIIFAKLKGFTFVSAGPHLVNILPDGHNADPGDMLNVPVTHLHLVDTSPSNIFNNPARYIPALHAALHIGEGCTIGPGLRDAAPGITITTQDTTLLGVLNLVSLKSIAAAEHHRGPAWGWVYLRERSPSDSPRAHKWEAHGGWLQGKHRDW